MTPYATLGATLSLVAGLLGTNAIAQSTPDMIEAHMAAAKAAAGTEYAGVLQRLCIKPDAGPSPQVAPGAPPDRSTWLATPVKVFDNLYFVGTIEHSAWAVTTSDGIILVDTIYDYTIDAIVDGSKTKLPAVLKRKPGDPNPYVIGNDSVERYMKVAEECAKVALLRTK